MGLFIDVRLDPSAAKDPNLSRKLAEVCPVGIYATDVDGHGRVVEENVDECTLCELCLAVGAPDQVEVIKLYDGNSRLRRSGT